MIKRYCFTKWTAAPAVLLALAVNGCVSTADRPAPQEAAEQASGQMVSRDDRPPTDADVMYKVFAGEVLGADGDLDKAADEYLEAAMQSSDPEIAERATRIALAARAWQHVAMASVRWVLLDPERLEAREIASRAMLLLGDYSGAEHQLGGIVDLLADDPVRAWTAVAGLLATANDPGRADVVLTRLIEQKGAGGNADALFAQSQFAARSGDLDRASALIREAMELSPERAELLAWAGRVEVNRGDEARALELYQAAHELQPTDRSIAMALAELMRRAGRTAEAQQVLAGLRDDPGTRFSRIAFALESGLRDLAVEIYLGFETAEYEDTVEAAFQAAQGAELLGRVDEALEWYARLDGTRRGLVSALRSAYLMADQGRLQDARNVLSRMRLRREPEVMQDSFQAEGQILLEAGALEDAFDLLSEGLEALPDNTALQYSRSLVAARMERVAVAEEDLRAIIAREPQNATALNALGYTLADLTDRYGEAEGYIRAAYELQPGEASIIDSMGWVAYRLGRLEESEQYLREAWNLDQNAEIAAHLGEVLWMQDRRDEAREAFASGLAVDAENEVLLETMDRLGVKP